MVYSLLTLTIKENKIILVLIWGPGGSLRPVLSIWRLKETTDFMPVPLAWFKYIMIFTKTLCVCYLLIAFLMENKNNTLTF